MLNASRLIRDLLNTNWNTGNTGSRTPDFKEYWQKKRVPGYANTDVVYCYNRRSDEFPSATGNVARRVLNRVSVDVRTNLTDDQSNLMEAEAKRIIRANVDYLVPSGQSHSTVGQQVIIEIIGTTPFSNTSDSDYYHNYKRVIELDLTSHKELV